MKNKRKIKRGVKFINIFMIVVVLGLLIYGTITLTHLDQEVSAQVYYYGAPALFIVSIILDMIPQFISPIVALGTAIITGVNVHFAILATVLGSAIGATIGFAIGKKYMFEAVDILMSKKSVDMITHITNKYGKVIVPLAAVTPLPYLPVFLGAINFTKRNFIIYGLIPRALGIIAFGYLVGIF